MEGRFYLWIRIFVDKTVLLFTDNKRCFNFDKIPILSKAINLTSPMKYDIIDLSRFKKGKIFNG